MRVGRGLCLMLAVVAVEPCLKALAADRPTPPRGALPAVEFACLEGLADRGDVLAAVLGSLGRG